MRIKNSYINLALLISSTIVLVYFIPSSFNKILFPVYCILFFKSKNNAVWIVFFLLLIEIPGGLFSGGLREDMVRLPIYPIAAQVAISFEQMFIVTAFIKALTIKVAFKPLRYLAGSLKSLGIYFIVLIFASIIFGMSFKRLSLLYQVIVNLTLFYSIYVLFIEESEFTDFFKLSFPLAFVAFALQLYSMIAGHQLIALFKAGVSSTQGVFGMIETRPIELPHILLITFFGSLYFIFYKNNKFNKTYLLLVNVISFVSVFITATRTWFLAFAISYILLFLVLPGKLLKITLKNSIVLVTAILLLFSSALLKNQFSQAYKRISTIELMVQGDLTAGGTADRFTKKAPEVMKAFAKSNILFGAGFSDYYYEKGNAHVGYQNLLFNTGIIGVVITFSLFIKIGFLCMRLKSKLVKANPYKDSMIILVLWMLAILILNGTSQMVGYDVPTARILLLSIFVYFVNNQSKNAVSYSGRIVSG